MYETSCQSRFDARYWMLGAGACLSKDGRSTALRGEMRGVGGPAGGRPVAGRQPSPAWLQMRTPGSKNHCRSAQKRPSINLFFLNQEVFPINYITFREHKRLRREAVPWG